MAKKRTRKALDTTLPIYQVKITLEHIKPPIWREVQTSDCFLDELHDIIQVSMGWEGEHMHAFVIEGEQYTHFENADQYEYGDSRKVHKEHSVCCFSHPFLRKKYVINTEPAKKRYNGILPIGTNRQLRVL